MLFTNTEYNNVCACCDAILRMCIMIDVGPLESDLPRASNVLRPALVVPFLYATICMHAL